MEPVLDEGRATWNEERLLLMERNGYPEETYFTFSYSPVANDHGGVGGVFCACSEDTQRVLGREADADPPRAGREDRPGRRPPTRPAGPPRRPSPGTRTTCRSP